MKNESKHQPTDAEIEKAAEITKHINDKGKKILHIIGDFNEVVGNEPPLTVIAAHVGLMSTTLCNFVWILATMYCDKDMPINKKAEMIRHIAENATLLLYEMEEEDEKEETHDDAK